MTAAEWRMKIAALLHDGVLKHDAAWYSSPDNRRGHRALARQLGLAIDEDLDPDSDTKGADLWSSAADRPELGSARHVIVRWRSKGRVTHPLCRASLVLLPRDRSAYRPSSLTKALFEVVAKNLEAIGLPASSGVQLDTVWHWLWRAQRGAQHREKPNVVPVSHWTAYVDLHPADTRSPDISLWDHVRVTSALSFLPSPENPPYLLHVAIGPVSRWLREARTTRDTWLGSMLLSEISLAAMRPVIEACGPDAILYPDLARNLRYDRELARRQDAGVLLTSAESEARTRSALIPNRWLAVVPHQPGGRSIEALGAKCQDAARQAWREIYEGVLAGFVRNCLADDPNADAIAAAWRLQCEREGELWVHFAAMPWHAAVVGALAATAHPVPAEEPVDDALAREWRATRRELLTWVPTSALWPYDILQRTWRTMRRSRDGSDYAPSQHAVRSALAARQCARTFAASPLPSGDACTVCGHRTALAVTGDDADRQRAHASVFWARIAGRFRWDDEGKERLCGVCATRRFLVPPWREQLPDESIEGALPRFYHVWATKSDEDPEQRLQLPMPSTAAIAAGPWLRGMLTDETLSQARADAHRSIGKSWPKTHFPTSLQAIGGSIPDLSDEFTWYEPSMYFDGPRLAELAAHDEGSAQATDRTIRQALSPLFEAPRGRPSSRFAVIAVDGDKLGDLLLGSSIKATWRDILHPAAVARIEHQSDIEHWAREWKSFLDTPRLMGPSLHAFINRALTAFANRIVPWVVEREFAGRLIYAGGDDVLALAPADDALRIAHRLQELWSAPWVHDSTPDALAWDAKARWDPEVDRARFKILSDESQLSGLPEAGEIVPMLGPHHSLSAGIAYAHFKTPLGLVIEAAREALDSDAKGRAGRSACAERLFTRGGPKIRSAFQWQTRGDDARPAFDVVRAVTSIRTAFREGAISSRLPYKLAGHRAAFAGLNDPQRSTLAAGLVRVAIDGGHEDADDLAALWNEGIRVYKDADVGLGNLLMCRALAFEESDA